jgi:hypothetical protein
LGQSVLRHAGRPQIIQIGGAIRLDLRNEALSRDRLFGPALSASAIAPRASSSRPRRTQMTAKAPESQPYSATPPSRRRRSAGRHNDPGEIVIIPLRRICIMAHRSLYLTICGPSPSDACAPPAASRDTEIVQDCRRRHSGRLVLRHQAPQSLSAGAAHRKRGFAVSNAAENTLSGCPSSVTLP